MVGNSLNRTSGRNYFLDLFRLVAAICIIGIHSRVFRSVSSRLDFVVSDILFRWAVPFFAICSGFYLAKKLKIADGRAVLDRDAGIIFKRRAQKALVLYLQWSLFYLLFSFLRRERNDADLSQNMVSWLGSFLAGDAYYHTWYLLQLFFGYIYIYIILSFTKLDTLPFVIFFLWISGCYAYAYCDVIPFDAGREAAYFCRHTIGASICSVWQIVPLMLSGFYLANRPFESERKILAGLFISFILLCCEALVLRHAGGIFKYSYIFFILPFSYFFFAVVQRIGESGLVDLREGSAQFFARTSMLVYLLHPAILVVLEFFGIHHSVLLFVACTVITVLLCFFMSKYFQPRSPWVSKR